MVGVPWMLVVSCWRARWRSLLVVAVMVGLTGGFGAAAVAGARRSASSPERFHESAHSRDLWITGADDDQAPIERLLDGPLVADHLDLLFVLAMPDPARQDDAFFFAPTDTDVGVGLHSDPAIDRGVLLDGRRADPTDPDEIVLSEVVARQYGLGPGDTLRLNTLSPAQATAMVAGESQPTSFDGPQLRMRVVGVVRTGFDIAARPDEPLDFVFTPAFLERYGDTVGLGAPSHRVRLADLPDARSRFTDALEQAYAGADATSRPGIDLSPGELVQSDAISVITAGLAALALVVVVAGVVWIAAAVSRQQRVSAGDLDVLRVLGSTRAERLWTSVAVVAPGLLAGAVLVPAVAIALSPLFPVGLARRFEPDPGVHADLVVLGVGTLVLLVVVGLVATLSGVRVVDRSQRQRPPAGLDTGQQRISRLTDRVGRWLGPAPAAGVRFALAAPRSLSVPVRPALVGAMTGVLGLAGVAVVGTSLDRFVETPARWGTTWDVAVPLPATGRPDHEALLDDHDIAAAALGRFDEQVTLDGHETRGSTLDPVKGDLGPTVVEGRAPHGDDEVAVGSETLDALGADVGELVEVGSRSSRSSARTEFRIVGVVLFPTVGFSFPLADGAAFTRAGGDRLGLGDPTREDAGFERLLVRWAPGVDHGAALQHLIDRTVEAAGIDPASVFLEEPDLPTAPPEVNGLRDVRLFPAAAAAALVLLGVISTGHALAVTVRRRRAELGVLSALGFTARQRRLVITSQATAVACVALVVGVPLGAVAGRLVWAAIAGSMGVAGDAAFPLGLLLAGAPAVLLVLNVIGALPARSAARLPVAEALRSE